MRSRSESLVIAAAALLLLGTGAAAGAEEPRIAAFRVADSLAIVVDCADLFTPRRIDRLDEGYPLSYTLHVSLHRYDPLWFDTRLQTLSAAFRVIPLRWEECLDVAVRDFGGRISSTRVEGVDDVLLELEDRLFTTVAPQNDLHPQREYYFGVEVEYRNLTLEDVKSTERWLREGAGSDSTADVMERTRSVGEQALGFLWELAGLKAEKADFTTDRFRWSDLRRLE